MRPLHSPMASTNRNTQFLMVWKFLALAAIQVPSSARMSQVFSYIHLVIGSPLKRYI